jgi:hypothetical protein
LPPIHQPLRGFYTGVMYQGTIITIPSIRYSDDRFRIIMNVLIVVHDL